MTYIGFLDGIRALAVSLVFIFHLNPEWLPGGFIGVDIFFVISGFLITQIISKRILANNFNYIEFLWSRCKRLLPAYLFLLTVVAIVSSFILLPKEILSFSKSLVYSIPFLSNIFFYLNSGYFEGSAEYFPLLHTWSLAVEWQFYLVFPFLILVLHRYFFKKLILALIGLTILLSLLSISITSIDPSLAFYLSPFRASEFILGGLASYLVNKKININSMLLSFTSILSFLALLCMSFFLNGDSVFPGTNALIVALLAAILIFSLYTQSNSLLKDLLSSKPLKFLGKISYSFYLWHWPIILFSKYYFTTIESLPIYVFIIVLTTLCSVFSYYYIENILRNSSSSKTYSRNFIVVYSLILTTVLSVFHFTHGLSFRLDEVSKKTLAVPSWQNFPGKCEYTQRKDDFYQCDFGEEKTEPTILLWGDSHAQTLVWNYDELATEKNKKILSFTKGGCPPVFGGVLVNSPINKNICLNMQKSVLDLLNSENKITDIIITAKWDGYIGKKLQVKTLLNDNVDDDFISLLDKTISHLQNLGYHVHLIDSIPYPGWKVPERIARMHLLNKEITSYYSDLTPKLYSNLNTLLNLDSKKLTIYSPKDYLCIEGECSTVKDNNPLYFDSNHLSIYGVDIIQPILIDTLRITDNEVMMNN